MTLSFPGTKVPVT